jgi:hypothetical protein
MLSLAHSSPNSDAACQVVVRRQGRDLARSLNDWLHASFALCHIPFFLLLASHIIAATLSRFLWLLRELR